jgi:hypothetical protein
MKYGHVCKEFKNLGRRVLSSLGDVQLTSHKVQRTQSQNGVAAAR